MYTIKHADRVLFDPSTAEYLVEAPVLSLEANRLASLEFTIYPDNPEYDRIENGTSVLSVYRDGTLMLRLRPMQKRETFAGGMTYKCEEQAAMLDDVLHRPDYFEGTVRAYMQRMINAYNGMVDSAHRVTLGNVEFNATTSNKFINDDYEGFWEALVSNLADVYGGYLVPRYTASALYIDYVADSDLPVCGQTVQFGENMADLFLETETSETYTVLIPLGADVDVDDPEEGQAKQRPLTIASVNSGMDYLENAAGIAVYGRREKVQEWKGIDDASALKAKGQAFLTEHAAQLKKSIKLSALDLHYLDVDTAAITWMTRIPIKSALHNIDTQYTATKLDLNLGIPGPIRLQMGEPDEVFTDRVPKNSVSKRRSRAGGRGGGGRAASSSDVEHWEMIVRKEFDILVGSGVKEIYESGIILDAESGIRLYNLKDIILGDGEVAGLAGEIEVQAGKISQIVSAIGSDGVVTAASIIMAINGSTSEILISADKINLEGYVTTSMLEAAFTDADQIACNQLTVSNYLQVGAYVASWKQKEVVTSLSLSSTHSFLWSDGTSYTNGRLVTGRDTSTIYYLGR